MNSAAVIGRQLRQQATSSRISGPVVPPTQYKGIHRVPSNYSSAYGPRQQDRDLQSLATQSNLGADADKKFAKFSQLYCAHEFYPHPAHRETGEKSVRSKDKKKKEPQVVLSFHCFCVALKALSSGIILLLAGTVMSVVGFFADSLSQESVRLQNGTLVTKVDDSIKTHLHNLTYVGPVVMGLGGMVLVAACVLTFEVRDTLGVKLSPEKVEKLAEKGTAGNTTEKSNHQMTPNSLPHSSRENHAHKPKSDNALNQNHFLKPSTANSANHHQQQLNEKTRISEKSADSGLEQEGGQRCRNEESTMSVKEEKVYPNERYSSPSATNVISQPERSVSTTEIFSIDCSFVRIPSPQDTEISDPEGCSLNALSRWKSHRCSCSGSPTHSMLLALHSLDDRQRSPQFANGLPRPHVSQLPHRYSRILASVESDGLSSSTSSEWDISNDFRMLETPQQPLHRTMPSDHHLLARQLDDSRELPCTVHYSPDSLGHRNSPKSRGNVNLPQRRSSGGTLDANCKSPLAHEERSDRRSDHRPGQTCYPLLELQPKRESSCQPN